MVINAKFIGKLLLFSCLLTIVCCKKRENVVVHYVKKGYEGPLLSINPFKNKRVHKDTVYVFYDEHGITYDSFVIHKNTKQLCYYYQSSKPLHIGEMVSYGVEYTFFTVRDTAKRSFDVERALLYQQITNKVDFPQGYFRKSLPEIEQEFEPFGVRRLEPVLYVSQDTFPKYRSLEVVLLVKPTITDEHMKVIINRLQALLMNKQDIRYLIVTFDFMERVNEARRVRIRL